MRSTSRNRLGRWACVAAVALPCLSCGADAQRGEGPPEPRAESPPSEPSAHPAEAAAPDAEGETGGRRRDRLDSVVAEAAAYRDPFQPWEPPVVVPPTPSDEDGEDQGRIVLEDVGVEEMRLTAIVSDAGGGSRAMLVGPDGRGWVVRRGDRVGRGETVRVGLGRAEVTLRWRVTRVRPDRVILTRATPGSPGSEVARVIRLRPEEA